MSQLFIGIMSGSSLDGVDVALTEFCDNQCKVIATHFLPYSADIKKILLTLHTPIINELENSVLAGNALALIYAGAVNTLLVENNFSPKQITAIGCHGQTIRHCPQKTDGVGYTIQIGNHALLSERTNITVIGDFRSRDIAAGGQGAPLVPAFHQALFGSVRKNRAIINIGGIANITYLSKSGLDDAGDVIGFDSGPGNMLLDSWIKLKRDKDYDLNGQWAATGKVTQKVPAGLPDENASVSWEYYKYMDLEIISEEILEYEIGKSTTCFIALKEYITIDAGNQAKMDEYNELILDILQSGSGCFFTAFLFYSFY